jgi:hypothetical protein
MNDLIKELLQRMSVKHQKATPYYPQANRLVEKSNGIICGIITKLVKDNCKQWDQHGGEALWAYRTAHKLPIGYTPFQLIYGFEVVMPIELEITSLGTTLQHNLDNEESITSRLYNLEGLNETRRATMWNIEVT